MKKTQAKRLAAMLMCAIMLLSTVALPITVSAETELVNHYDVSTSEVGIPKADDITGLSGNSNYFATAPIEVKAGDKIYFGPLKKYGWHIALYDNATTPHSTLGTVYSNTLTVEDTFANGAVIYSYTVPEDIVRIRITGDILYRYNMLLTVGQAFDTASYLAWAEANGVGVSNALCPRPLKNVYDASGSVIGIPSTADATKLTNTSTSYFATTPIRVQEGSTIYVGPINTNSGWNVALYDNLPIPNHVQSGVKLTTVVDECSDGTAIYSYTIPAGVIAIRLTANPTYKDTMLVTIGQEFNEAAYLAYVNAGQGGDENQLVNKYNPALATVNKIPDIGNSTGFASGSNTNFFASSAIEVQGGDTIYVGPINTNSGWNVALYDNTPVPNNKQNGVKLTNKVAEFPNGVVIYSYTIPEGTVAIRLTANPAYMNTMLVTINQAFDVESYYAYADANGLVLSNELRPMDIETPTMANVASTASLVNLFPRTDAYNALLRQNENVDTYKTSSQIPVAAGDVITIGAMRQADSEESLYFYNANGNLIKTLEMNSLPVHEDIGRGYNIYWLTVPASVSAIEVKAHVGVYNDGDILVTKNQPFSGAQLRTFLDIPDLSAEALNHAFSGKKALFIGDSISYGSYDTPPSYRNPSASWARRLALETGLVPTNASVGGATIAKYSGKGWIYNQYNALRGQDFDMIVMQGGTNDARAEIAIGSILPIDTDAATLEAATSTYIGGLQWLFHNVKSSHPDADLYFVATFKVPQQKGNLQSVNQYYAQAELLCKMYGVKFVDMHNYAPLYEDYNPNDKTIVPDQLHPTKAGYDIIFPHMLEVFESVQIPDPEFDLDMLNVSYQFSTDNQDIRLITTVDGLDYQEVGFIITMGNQRAKISMNTVYSSITGADKTYTPDLVGAPTSEYFALFNITDIPEEFTIFVQAYVVTEDGYTYYGSVRDITKSNGTLILEPNGTEDGYVVSWNDLNWKAAA